MDNEKRFYLIAGREPRRLPNDGEISGRDKNDLERTVVLLYVCSFLFISI